MKKVILAILISACLLFTSPLVKRYYQVDPLKCDTCNGKYYCRSYRFQCPKGAIKQGASQAWVDTSECNGCGWCKYKFQCPKDAFYCFTGFQRVTWGEIKKLYK